MRTSILAAAACAAFSLAACGGKPSAVANTGQAASSGAPAVQAGPGIQQAAAVPLVDGKPMWAANRLHSAFDNARYQFMRNGNDFGARTEHDYVLKVHAFVEQPPKDAQFLDRSNGDRLIYAPRANTFAVVTREGAPRTMFKPRSGSAYWTQQKEREAARAKAAASPTDQG